MHTLLKQASAAATQYATEDQASGLTDQTNEGLEPFELDISEQAPTSDQLRNILQYVGANNAGRVIKGSKNETDALRKLKENPEAFQRPVVCTSVFFPQGSSPFFHVQTITDLVNWPRRS